MNLLRQLWRDERGEVSATSVILLYTVLALGAITGLVVMRNQLRRYVDLLVR